MKYDCLCSNLIYFTAVDMTNEKYLNFLHFNFLIYKNGDDNDSNFVTGTINVHQISSALLISQPSCS